MKKYETKQRKRILAVLSEHTDKQFYIEDLEEMLNSEGQISRSAIYRNIKQMVEEGVIKKYASNNGRKYLYQYFESEGCLGHIHLKCLVCGKIYHLDNQTSIAISNEIAKSSQFKIDKGESFLYGVCNECV